MKRLALVLLAACGAKASDRPAATPAPAASSVTPVVVASVAAPPSSAPAPALVIPRGPPRTVTLKSSGETEMSLGDTARSDRWRVELVSYDEGVLSFSAGWRALEGDALTATATESRNFCDFEKMGMHIRLEVQRFPTAAAPSIVLVATESDGAMEARFGQELRDDGFYRFSDGLRVQYRYSKECDYDPSEPCVETHKVTAYYEPAKKPPLDATLKTPRAIKRCELGHGFAAVHRHLRVTQTCQ